MKIKSGFILRDVGGKTFVSAVGARSAEVSGLITLNETGKIIWKTLENESTVDDVVDALINACEGDIDRAIVEADVRDFIAKLEGDNILE